MAYGFVPVRTLGSGLAPRVNSAGIQYTIASGYSTKIGFGDLVYQHTDGTLKRAAGAEGTPTPTLVGVFAGVEYTNSAGEVVFSKFWPASTTATNIKAYVYDDPMTIFRVEADQDTTPLAEGGMNVDIYNVSDADSNGISTMKLDSSSQGTSSAQIRVLRSAEDDGAFTSAGTAMDVECFINEHVYRITTGT